MSGQPVPIGTKLAYGFGAVAYGIKDNGFSVFLLLFYNQVIGLPAHEVGLAILIALLIDACIDPLVGALSDRTRTRWGRRHPWLYASALPIALVWLLLWNPPDLPVSQQFWYLLGVAVLVRAAVSCYEVPSIALVPEITRDYHERTVVVRYRFLFGWAAGLVMLALAYGVFLLPDAEYPVGQLNPRGYEKLALVGSIAMLIAVLVSALGTHRRLARPVAVSNQPAADHSLRAILGTLNDRPFLILMAAGIFTFANQGMTFALSNYLLLYIWEFPQAALIIYAIALFGGVFLAFLAVPRLAGRLGKKHGAALTAFLSAIVITTPYWLRAVGAFPEPGSPWLMPVFLTMIGLATMFNVCSMILTTSMMADVTDAAELRTARREEGLFFAGYFFVQKCVTGIGIFLSGTMLALIGFPEGAQPGAVPAGTVDALALVYGGLTLFIGFCGAWCFLQFPFGRNDHEDRLRQLSARRERNARENEGITLPTALAESDCA